jgi:CDP-paratose 2-epimerase
MVLALNQGENMEKVLITGGSGFIGSNLAASLLADGASVTIYDNLSRAGAVRNLGWLRNHYDERQLCHINGDVRDASMLDDVVANGNFDTVFHFAAQVAVTTSVADPRTDFDINAGGTFNLLEAVRCAPRRRSAMPPVVFLTSTNKVYGALEHLGVELRGSRYAYRDREGVDETCPLDFHSPYGCSKGTADQYMRDYARIYDLPTVVFRMSCIYGPRQFGNEDQGWVAHFIIAALRNRPLTIYGNGKQVRDVLFVEDLVRAFRLARENISATAGQVYNIGGGAGNTIAIWSELAPLIKELHGSLPPVSYAEWRPGDQPIYVSDTTKAARDFGWQPAVEVREGVTRLYDWAKGFFNSLVES